MTKQIYLLVALMLLGIAGSAQVKIHSHNDYTHQKPFYDASANRVFSIEADVFVVGDSLIVAHSRKEIKEKNTLQKLYLEPIAAFAKTDKFYSFQLMIDFKDSWDLTYPVLLKALKPYQKYFVRGNKKVTIAISGNRPPDSTFRNYTDVSFDGLPNVDYAPSDLRKITMISDNFATYSKWKGVGAIADSDKAKLKELINNAHKIGKPFRFWNAPDTEACWKLLQELGADIINTDKVAEARKYFSMTNRQ